jgi:hypothetical protein
MINGIKETSIAVHPLIPVQEYGLSDTAIDDFAALHRLLILQPTWHEVQVDIDLPYIPKIFLENLEILQVFEKLTEYRWNYSKGGNVHITVVFARILKPHEHVEFAALLGSDRKREMLNLKNLFMSRKRPIFFYERAHQLEAAITVNLEKNDGTDQA